MTDLSNQNTLEAGYKLHWYEIESVLGQGSFGITYLARDTNLDRRVAIKEYLPSDFAFRTGDNSVHPLSGNTKAQFEWFLERFIKEARILSKFEHPNIVRIFAVFEENNTGYIIMPYEEGVSLQSLLKSKKTLDESTLIRIIEPILDGLELVHQHEFIHRDIKPDNIFIRKDGSPVLLDFGSARQAVVGEVNTLTSLVTPGYAPFEQYYSKSDEQGPWTDIYGLGATLYHAIAGKAPIDAVDRSKTLLDGSKDTFISALEIGADRYSDQFLKAIEHAMSFKLQDRPQSISEWRNEFDFSQENIEASASDSLENLTIQPKQQAKLNKNNIRKTIAVFLTLTAIIMAILLSIEINNNDKINMPQKVVSEETMQNISPVTAKELPHGEDKKTSEVEKNETAEEKTLKMQLELESILEKERKLIEEERVIIEEERKRLDEIRQLELKEKQFLIEEEKRIDEKAEKLKLNNSL